MRAALGNPGSAVAAQGFLSVPGLLESQELHTMQEQGTGESERVHPLRIQKGLLPWRWRPATVFAGIRALLQGQCW